MKKNKLLFNTLNKQNQRVRIYLMYQNCAIIIIFHIQNLKNYCKLEPKDQMQYFSMKDDKQMYLYNKNKYTLQNKVKPNYFWPQYLNEINVFLLQINICTVYNNFFK